MTVEIEDALDQIRSPALALTSPAKEALPYLIRIYTLGRFAIFNGSATLQFSGKVQKKPLALLKAVIALGGKNIAASALCDFLWPDSAGDNARHALDMAVSRLRKLLGSSSAILVHDAKFSVNDKIIWVDARAFEQSADEYHNQNRGAPGITLRLGAEALKQYAGTFLMGEEDMPWLLGYRERLRAAYLQLVLNHGALLEKHGKYQEAINCYHRALEVEPLAEEIYQGVMQCHLTRGEYAKTVEAFQRCQKTLSVFLGVRPSIKTEGFAARARANASMPESSIRI